MRSVCLGLLVYFAIPSRLPADHPTSAQPYATAMEAIFEAVLDHHIQPPTRQEMVLALVRQLHKSDSQAQLADLSKAVSEIGGKDALYEFMRQEIDRNAANLDFDPNRIERVDIHWLNPVVTGGVSLDSPKNADVGRQLAANRYVGIGVQLTKDETGFVFPLVMENGTAARGGILAGDRLIKINGASAEGPLENVIDQLRGPEGSQLQLTVKSKQDEPRDIELRRQVVVIKSVGLEPLRPGDSTAHINIENIKASTVHELQTIIEQLPESITGIQLKLEFDGDFHYFHLLADALLDDGVLGEVVTRDGRRTIRTFDGNILAGRKLTIELADQSEQQRLLGFLALRADAHVSSEYVPSKMPIYLQEAFPILDGRAIVSLSARRFQKGPAE